MDKYQTLTSFWNGFSIPAYDETSVPSDAKLPYITFENVTDDFGNLMSCGASVWYRDTSWAAITEKAMQIDAKIGRGGVIVNYENGAVWLHRGTPWMRHMEEPSDDTIRRIVLNLNVEYLD